MRNFHLRTTRETYSLPSSMNSQFETRGMWERFIKRFGKYGKRSWIHSSKKVGLHSDVWNVTTVEHWTRSRFEHRGRWQRRRMRIHSTTSGTTCGILFQNAWFKGPWYSSQSWTYVVKFKNTFSLRSVWGRLMLPFISYGMNNEADGASFLWEFSTWGPTEDPLSGVLLKQGSSVGSSLIIIFFDLRN